MDHSTRREQTVTLLRLGRVLNFMKHLLDVGAGLPPPSLTGLNGIDPRHRMEAGQRLLAAFLADGAIRGITPEGEVYAHRVSPGLIAQFLNGLGNTPLRGSA